MYARRAAASQARRGPHRRTPSPTAGRLPWALLAAGDTASRAAGMLDLQRSSGNRAVSLLVRAHEGNGNTPSIRLHGESLPAYDGGKSQVLDRLVTRAKGCDCPDDNPCLTGTGTLQVTYHVDVTITMPGAPGGLSQCQQRRVREFLRTVLGPHEQDHARRLRTYNGTTRRRFSVTSCGQQALTDDVTARLQEMHDTEDSARRSAADTLSAAIDPFERPIDLNC